MKIRIRNEHIKNAYKEYQNSRLSEYKSYHHYSDDYSYVSLTLFTNQDLNYIIKEAEKEGDSDTNNKPMVKKMLNYMSLKEGDSSNKEIALLTNIPALFQSFMKDAPHKWVFMESSDDVILPWYVKSVEHVPTATHDGWTTPAHVDFELRSYENDSKHQKKRQIEFYKEDLDGKPTIKQLLAKKGIYKETQGMIDDYSESIAKFLKFQIMTGKQFIGTGTATIKENTNNWWSWVQKSKRVSLVKDGIPSKLVMDETEDSKKEVEQDEYTYSRSREKEDVSKANTKFWIDDMPVPFSLSTDLEVEIAKNKLVLENPGITDEELSQLLENIKKEQEENKDKKFEQGKRKKKKNDDDEDDDDEIIIKNPFHPYMRLFDLEKHAYLRVYVDNLELYQWNGGLFNKLIINQEHKDLINMLMNSTSNSVEDIIKGKMAGIIVVATGPPGVGKTLTAEIFSEKIQKPLYSIQCSQLGLDVNEVEKNLKTILSRAARWDSILLIDEADVYIRERSDDMTQNAIVGVFLRVLEYYRGIMFMTSNRGDIIDDAIMSRATAWIQYEIPDEKELSEIWKVLGKQFETDFTDAEAKELASFFLGISGRTVRNLMKLSNLLSKQDGGKVTIDLIKKVAKFQKLELEQFNGKALAK